MANIYDSIINGSFDAIGAKPGYLSPPTSVEEMYRGIHPPAAPKQTYQSGMTGRGLPASIGMDRLPQGTAGLPSPAGSQGISPQQWQAIGGWTVDPRTGQLAYSQPGQQTNPAVAAATQQAQNVSLPRRRPPNAPNWMDLAAMTQPKGANPGLGGAMVGDGQMASSIPPQGPPPAGIAPTVWAGDQPQAKQPLNITVRGGKQGQTGTATNGYVYQNGQRVGKAPWTAGLSPSRQYENANMAGQIAAMGKQATATGQTGTTIYKNGRKVGNVGGGTSAQAYEKAAAKSRDKGTSGEGGNPSWW